jgi:hypothetical protein
MLVRPGLTGSMTTLGSPTKSAAIFLSIGLVLKVPLILVGFLESTQVLTQ